MGGGPGGVELAYEVGAEVTFVTVRHNSLLLGDPALDRAEREADDRGILHEYGGLASALIGSVSRTLLTRSPAPVMVVRGHSYVPNCVVDDTGVPNAIE